MKSKEDRKKTRTVKKTVRRTYATPKVAVYGKVSELTQRGGGGAGGRRGNGHGHGGSRS